MYKLTPSKLKISDKENQGKSSDKQNQSKNISWGESKVFLERSNITRNEKDRSKHSEKVISGQKSIKNFGGVLTDQSSIGIDDFRWRQDCTNRTNENMTRLRMNESEGTLSMPH